MKPIYIDGEWKIKTTLESEKRTGRRFLQTIVPSTNQYVDLTFQSEAEVITFIINR